MSRALFARFALTSKTLLPALLLAEGLLLGVALDSASLARLRGGWWDGIFAVAPRVMPVSAAIAAAGLLVAGPRLRERLARLPERRSCPRHLLLVHLACFGLLFGISSVLCNGGLAAGNAVGLWVAACLVSALLTCVSWLAAFAGPRTLHIVVRETGGLLLASVAVGVLAWAAGDYTQGWWDALRAPTLRAAHGLLRAADATAWADPDRFLIGAGSFAVEVSSACSGYEGVGLFWVFLGTFFWVSRSRLRFPHVLLLLPLGTAAVLVGNVVRIAALVAIGARVSPAVAAGGFHSYAGVVLFCAISLATAAVACRATFFCKTPAPPDPGGSATDTAGPTMPVALPPGPANPAAPFLVPFLATVAAALMTGMFSAGAPERFYPVRVAVTAGALWHYRHSYRSGAAALGAHTWPVPLLVGLAVFVLWVGSGVWRAAPAPPGPTALVGPESPSWRAAWLLIRVVGSVVTVPLAEELAFRGFFARRLMAADFESVSLRDVAWPAALVSSALFGALHGMPVAGTVAGLAFLWAARRSGRLADAVIAHATANGLLAAYVLATQSWWLWA